MNADNNTNIFYRIIYRLKTDPEEWHIKCNCKELWQAEKFIDNLQQCSNVYQELKIVSVQYEQSEGKAK